MYVELESEDGWEDGLLGVPRGIAAPFKDIILFGQVVQKAWPPSSKRLTIMITSRGKRKGQYIIIVSWTSNHHKSKNTGEKKPSFPLGPHILQEYRVK